MKLIHALFLLGLLACSLYTPNPVFVKAVVGLILVTALGVIISK